MFPHCTHTSASLSSFSLRQAYHVEQDIAAAREEVRQQEAALAEAERSQGVSEREVEARRREQAGVAKERLLLEKKVKKKQAEADKQVWGPRAGSLCAGPELQGWVVVGLAAGVSCCWGRR